MEHCVCRYRNNTITHTGQLVMRAATVVIVQRHQQIPDAPVNTSYQTEKRTFEQYGIACEGCRMAFVADHVTPHQCRQNTSECGAKTCARARDKNINMELMG